MKRYAVTHTTKYTYGEPVELGLHSARLSPMDSPRQKLLDHMIEVSPTPTWAMVFTDHFGNSMHHITVETPHDELIVTQRTTIDIVPPTWTQTPTGPAWEDVRDSLRADGFPEYPDVAEFVYASPLVPIDDAATAYAAESFKPGSPIIAAAFELTRRFKADFSYSPGSTTISTPVGEIMSARRGVCQDFTHAMISGLRGLGLPARYVSGYLRTYAAPTAGTYTQANQPLVGADASHAWVAVWCGPDWGWLEFDPTNALMVHDEHIATAFGRDFLDVTPLRGVITGGGQHSLAVAVTVQLLDTPSS